MAAPRFAVDADEELLGQLKRKRMELASERRVPAYVIFSDRSLIDMADKAAAHR